MHLDSLFNPNSVAVVGASANPDKLGFHVMQSLIRGGYGGRIIPINPAAGEILGFPAHASLTDCPHRPDMAVIVVPARHVPPVLEHCARLGLGGVVLITAGFKEIEDPRGAEQQAELAERARQAGIPVIGPNTFGLVNLHARLNASFTPEFSLLRPGSVGLVSQSGGISHLLAFAGLRQNVGFSKIVGLGNRLNLDFADMVRYLDRDPDTAVIALYLEGLDTPRPLLQAAAEVGRRKPIVAFKTGRGNIGDRASLAHTGTLAGNHSLYAGAFRQTGVLQAGDSETFLDALQALACCPLPQGPGIAVLTGQAGPGMAACDELERHGLRIARFRDGTRETINRLLPPLALRSNPVDMGPAWYDPAAVEGIVRAAAEDPGVNGILLLTVFASANREVLPGLLPYLSGKRPDKPFITCFSAPEGIWDHALQRMGRANILNLPTPERAARAMAVLWHRTRQINAVRR